MASSGRRRHADATDTSAPRALPRSLCRGDLGLGGEPIECHVLDDERRVFSSRGMTAALNGSGAKDGHSERQIARILRETSLSEVGPRIRFVARGGIHVGYPAELLPRLCAAITDLRIAGKLHHKQAPLADRARQIEKALAGVAIVALVDEATGYQSYRAPDALARLFDAYFLPQPGDWERAIPDELYALAARLYGYIYTLGQPRRPLFLRSWTWRYVYDFLPSDVRDELQRRNPNPHEGSTRHHQHFTPRVREVLTAHLLRLTSVVRQSASPSDFRMRFDCEFRGAGLQLSFGAP